MNGVNTINKAVATWIKQFQKSFHPEVVQLESATTSWLSISLPSICTPATSGNIWPPEQMTCMQSNISNVPTDHPPKQKWQSNNQQSEKNRAWSQSQTVTHKYLCNPLLELVDIAAEDPSVLGSQGLTSQRFLKNLSASLSNFYRLLRFHDVQVQLESTVQLHSR
jgi:hypothetical protein